MGSYEKCVHQFVALDDKGNEYQLSVWQGYAVNQPIDGERVDIPTMKEIRCDSGRIRVISPGKYRLLLTKNWRPGQPDEIELSSDDPGAP